MSKPLEIAPLVLILLALAIGCSPGGTSTVESTRTPAQMVPTETPSPAAQPAAAPTQMTALPRQKIAYLVESVLYIFDPQTGITLDYTEAYVRDDYDWSVDGHSVFFVGWRLNAATGYPDYFVYRLNIDTGEIAQIGRDKFEISLSPDGRNIAFTAGYIGVMNIDGTSAQILTSTPGSESFPVWSPDGSKIAYLYGEKWGYTNELRILNLADSSTYTLFASGTDIGPFDWTPDGEGIAFAYDMYECTNIFEIKLADQSITQLTDLRTCTYSPNWSLDGKWLVFQASNLRTGNWWAREWNIYGLFDGEIRPLITGIDASPPYPKISPVPYLDAGKICAITGLGNGQQLFSSASLTSEVLGRLTEGDSLLVLSGPVDTDGYYWWLVQTRENVQGWVQDVAGWYSCEDD